MNVVDSSGWLEYFADGKNAGVFANPIQDLEALLVPTISLYEVFKHVLILRSEGDALRAVATMQQGTVIDLDSDIAISAAKISAVSKIPMADSVMLASARAHGATLWSQDEDFADLAGVEYVEKE
ncbi:MAG: type II toxin-antitoxin system VapC family toxin [Anaerolineales bacterium]